MTANHPTNPWPNGAKCAISFTMDNLGEAQDVNKGLWPSDKPIGQHPSSWSLHVYPDAVRALRDRGHEVAWHGYQHETWHQLSGEGKEEEASFARSFAEAAAHGVFGISDGVVVLPFLWETVDAFWYMPKFASIRKQHGVSEEPLGPGEFREYLFGKFDEVKRDGGYISILFHPFLQTSEDRFEVLREVLARISSDDEIWCAPCGEVATWVREHASQFGFEA
ncbi:hypothetical protein VP1G_10505 [Cytospora mali]|uniref:NodB homology domain-containing protein n=1 Tax=Cytospora mali TaxID=578113 RepID=A0A194ULS7_CYTMA|nr:hypothetical protein VP1G_10505 [Valsa mali var. pyri (nom. inval.)]